MTDGMNENRQPQTAGNLFRLIDEEAVWVVVQARTGTIGGARAYLPEPHLWEVHRDGDFSHDDLAIACVLGSYGQWTVDRLASGLYGSSVCGNYADAVDRLEEVAF